MKPKPSHKDGQQCSSIIPVSSLGHGNLSLRQKHPPFCQSIHQLAIPDKRKNCIVEFIDGVPKHGVCLNCSSKVAQLLQGQDQEQEQLKQMLRATVLQWQSESLIPLQCLDLLIKVTESRTIELKQPPLPKYSHFLDDLKKSGSIFPKIQLVELSASNRKIVSTFPILKDQVLLFIPHCKLITLEMASQVPLVRTLQVKGGLRSPKHCALAIFLLLEKEKQQKSEWYQYINHFPTDFSSYPMNYDKKLLEMLKGSSFVDQIQQKEVDMRKDYEHIASLDSSFKRFSFKIFVEMRLIVSSRVFGIIVNKSKTDALVPLADMLNHHHPKQTSWAYNDQMGGFVIRSVRSIQSGEEIFDSYGQKCNSRFLLNYGFTLSNNPSNQAAITIPIMCQAVGQNKKTLKEDQFEQIEPRQITMRVNKPAEGKLFDELISACRFACLLQERRQPSLQLIKSTPFQNLQNEKNAWNLLSTALNSAMDSYPDSLKQDRRLLKGELNDAQRNIITLRKGEKEVIAYYQTMAKRVLTFFTNGSKRSQLRMYDKYLSQINEQ